MELKEAVLKRRSIRKYRKEPVGEDQINAILRAGLLAPTSMNRKPCTLYLVRDRQALARLSQAKKAGGQMIADCDAAIVVSADSLKADTWIEDASIALSYMQLAAVSEGIGSCWVQIHLRKHASGEDAEEEVRKILSLKETDRIVGILALGLPGEEKQPYTEEDADLSLVRRI